MDVKNEPLIYLDNFISNPASFIILISIIIVYYTLLSNLGINNGSVKGIGIVIFELILWSLFILLILVNGMLYIFDFNLIQFIRSFITEKSNIIIDPDNQMGGAYRETTVPEIKLQKQVFHIPENNYNYNDAKAICRAYGGRLATWKEIKDSYDNGADWCSYGWSDGQMALFPTQYDKWSELQKVEGHEQDCGRPGINGGYISNPNVKFGINCYGYKPVITGEEVRQMAIAPRHPLTKREIEFEKKVDYWRENLPQIQVSPFNHNNWSVV